MDPNMFLTALATIIALCSPVISAHHSTPDFQSRKQSLRRLDDFARVTQLVPDQSLQNLCIYLTLYCGKLLIYTKLKRIV